MTKTCVEVERVLWVACLVIMFVAMFAHMTALENMALGLVGIGTITAACSSERPSPLHWPLLWPIVAWSAWALASIAWSPYPRDSMHALLDEVLYPLVSFFAFWLMGTRITKPERIVVIKLGSLCAVGRRQPVLLGPPAAAHESRRCPAPLTTASATRARWSSFR